MKFINVAEAKAKFSEILRKSKKEDVIVTSRGKPTAIIKGLKEEDLEDFIISHSEKIRKRIEEGWEAYKKGDTVTLKEMINRGKRKKVQNTHSKAC